MESQTLNTEWVPIARDETVRETSVNAHEKSVNEQLNALMNEQRHISDEDATAKTNGHVTFKEPEESYVDEFPMSVEADDDAPTHDPEEVESLGQQEGRGKWTATIQAGDSTPKAPEIVNPLLPLKIKRGQNSVSVEAPISKRAKGVRGPYKKSTKQKTKEVTPRKKTPVKAPPPPPPEEPEDDDANGRRASRRAASAKRYTFSDQEEESDRGGDFEPEVLEDDGGEFEIESPKKVKKAPGRPKGRPPKNGPKTPAKAPVKAPVTPPKKGPPRGISKGPTKDTLVITKEEYKRLASVEKAFLKVKELNREMFMIMLQETKKQKENEEKGPAGGSTTS